MNLIRPPPPPPPPPPCQNPNPNCSKSNHNHPFPPQQPFRQFPDPLDFQFSDFLLPPDHHPDHGGFEGDEEIDNIFGGNYSSPQSNITATSPLQIGSDGSCNSFSSWTMIGNEAEGSGRMRKVEEQKKRKGGVVVDRVAFRTKSEVDVMDDSFKWRKYGKKSVKNTPYPRNYYKCPSVGCNVKKRVERDREDSSFVITTYEGVHNHHHHQISPSKVQVELLR